MISTQRLKEEKTSILKGGVGLSSLLFLLKGGSGIFCASSSLLASSLDSLMDAGVSFVNYLAARESARPPDPGHAYGHGKIESLASYTQGIVILGLAFAILMESLWRGLQGDGVFYSRLALLTVLVAAVLNGIFSFFLHQAQKKTESLILKAEEAHYLTDILSYVVLFLVFIAIRVTGWNGWDFLGGLLMASYVAFLAGRILWRAGNELADHSLPPSALETLDRLIKGHDPRVRGYHELRTRRVGPQTFIDFHLVMPPQESFEEAHEVAESLIQKIKSRFQNADVTIHEDPEGGI